MKYKITFRKVNLQSITRTLPNEEALETLIDKKINCEGFCFVDVMLSLVENGGVYKAKHAGNFVTIKTIKEVKSERIKALDKFLTFTD